MIGSRRRGARDSDDLSSRRRPDATNRRRRRKARQYIQKVIDAGGWANYERRHLDKLTAMLMPKDDARRRSPRRRSPLRRVPPEVLRKIAAFAFHAGYYLY